MDEFNYIESIASALIGAIATIVAGYFALRGQMKSTKVDDQKSNRDFILELQKQISTEREQMNEQRLQDTKAIAENMNMISNMQKDMNAMRDEIRDWRRKYFDLNEKYNELQAEHLAFKRKFSAKKNETE